MLFCITLAFIFNLFAFALLSEKISSVSLAILVSLVVIDDSEICYNFSNVSILIFCNICSSKTWGLPCNLGF